MVGGGGCACPQPYPPYAAPSHRRTSPPPSPPAAAGCMCGPGGRTHAPPRPPWAAVAALLALGSPHDPTLDYTYLTLRMTLRYAALRYAMLLLVAGCSSSPAAAARRSRPPRLRPSSSPASCACSFASRCSLRFREGLRLADGLRLVAPAPPTHIRKPAPRTRSRVRPPTFFSGGMASPSLNWGSTGLVVRR